MSAMEENVNDQPMPNDRTSNAQTSRGEFLKWGGVALGGLYVGPKITSFAVSKTGQAGSPAPSNNNNASYSSSYSSSSASVLPATGGAAGGHSARANDSHSVDHQDWVPAAGAGAAALGWYIRKQAKAQETAEVKAHDVNKTE